MARPKRLSSDAEQVNIRLTPEEQLVLQIIRVRRKKREDPRNSPSEVTADALRHYLQEIEGISPSQIESLLAQEAPGQKTKLRHFPKKEQN